MRAPAENGASHKPVFFGHVIALGGFVSGDWEGESTSQGCRLQQHRPLGPTVTETALVVMMPSSLVSQPSM